MKPGLPFVGGADVVKTLTITRANGEFEINGVPFNPPSVPVLLQILSGTTSATDLLPAGSVYSLPPNQTIEINIPGGGNVRLALRRIRAQLKIRSYLASFPPSWSLIRCHPRRGKLQLQLR